MTFKENGYILIENVLSNDFCKLATQYALFEQMNDVGGKNLEGATAQVPGTHSVYSDSLMESFLQFLKPVAEKHSELELIPTYSYYRIYKPGDVLRPHKDRPSCEISMTLTLDYYYTGVDDDYKWPLIMNNKSVVMGVTLFCIGGVITNTKEKNLMLVRVRFMFKCFYIMLTPTDLMRKNTNMMGDHL